MAEVWVVTTHSGHGEDSDVLGVYESREAAWDGLKAALPPGHKIWVKDDGTLQAKPRDESVRYQRRMYGFGEPYEVEGMRRGTREAAPGRGVGLRPGAVLVQLKFRD